MTDTPDIMQQIHDARDALAEQIAALRAEIAGDRRTIRVHREKTLKKLAEDMDLMAVAVRTKAARRDKLMGDLANLNRAVGLTADGKPRKADLVEPSVVAEVAAQ